MSRELTLLDSGTIDRSTVDRILQGVVFFADRVAVRASYEVGAGDARRANEISRRLHELHEQGLVSMWAHEYEVDDAGRLKTQFSAGETGRRADVVIDAASLRTNISEMNEILRSMRDEAYRAHPERALRQGVAEIVSLRNQLASLVISSELRQDGLLGNPAGQDVIARNLRSERGDSFQAAVGREVVSQLQLGSLNLLTQDEIDEARKYSADFRKLLDESLIAVARGMDPVITPAAAARELVSRYQAMTTEFGLRSKAGEVADEIAWDLIGMAVPSSIFLKYAFKAFNWHKESAEIRPFLMLLHLERAAHRHANIKEPKSM